MGLRAFIFTPLS